MKVVVIGGTGLIGSKVVTLLEEHGHDPIPASLDTGVNTITKEGLDDVLVGADVVVDLSNSPSWADDDVLAFFTTSTTNLLEAEKAAGVQHHVALSIVGCDRLPDSGYMRAKVAQENLITGGDVPYSIVRSTQFAEFMKGIIDAATEGQEVRVPHAFVQPIASDDVAAKVARTAVGAPLNGRKEIGGPEKLHMDEFFGAILRSLDDPRKVVTDAHAKYYDQELTEDSLVTGPGADLGGIRYQDWAAAATR